MDAKKGTAVVLLLTAGLLYRGGAQNTTAPSPAESGSNSHLAPEKSGGAASAPLGPWTPVCRYVATAAKEARGKSVEQGEEEGKTKEQFCLAPTDAGGISVTTMIATVPDPELTHLSLSFDRYVESITWAVSDGDLKDERYSFDGYWFPWRPDQKEETDSEKRTAAEKEREQRSNTPGILLFRRNPPHPSPSHPHPEKELLLVFLVGETPTSGINRVAFDRAWTYATKLADTPLPVCEAANRSSRTCVGILGPSFTGSVASLKFLLERKSAEADPLTGGKTRYETFAISGAVTGEDASTRQLTDDNHFCTTIETDRNRWAVSSQFLNNLSQFFWGAGRDIQEHFAVLAEDETAYGEAAEKPLDGEKRVSLVLRFPRGIARIRNSSEEFAGAVNPARSAAYPALPLILRDAGQDTIPSFSQQQSPVSQEAVLLELASALRREHIRYVGIVATDPLDALFLTRAIRALAPNIRIVLFNADLLLARASRTWGLSGVLAVTSYPLISRTQYYAGAVPPRRTQFASDSAEGEYNACRRMLLQASETADQPCSAAKQPQDRQPVKQDYLLDYSAPFAKPSDIHKPSVWLTILGRNEWWPVAALAGGTNSPLLEGPAPGAHNAEHFSAEPNPQPWSLFFWLISVLCTLHVVLVFGMNIGHARFVPWWRHSLLRRLGWEYKPDLGPQRRGTLTAASLTVAFGCGSLAEAVSASGLNGWGYVQLMVAIAVGAVAMAEGLWAAWGIKESRPRLLWLSAVAAAALAEIAGACYAVFSATAGHAREFAGYRAVHIESGASPVLPVILMLMTLYLFCWLRLSRLRMSEEREAQPAAGKDSEAFPDFVIPERAVQELGRGQWTFVAAAVLGWWIVFSPLQTLATIEGSLYDAVLAGLSSIVIFTLAFVLVRFLMTWRVLRKLLQNLERHPLRYAFSRLPKDFSWTTVWAGDPRPQLIMPARSLDVLRTIREVDVRAQVDEIEHEFKFLKNPGRPFDKVPHRVENLNRALNEAFGKLSRHMQSLWLKGVSDTIASREKKAEAPAEWTGDLRIAAEEFLALRFVTFISYALRIMRGFLQFITYAFIMLVLALDVYPFEGRRYIEAALVFIFVAAGASVVLVFAQMDRDPLLSRLSETKPNQLGINFVIRLASFGALPLLTLLASQVPDIGNFLQTWLQPALQAAK